MSSAGEARGGSSAPVISPDSPVVFVVDDDVSVRESVELLILSAGWQPETFASAEEFLERSPIDGSSCLVLDVTLPSLSGLDLQKRILDRADMPIIFITGYGDVPTTVEAMKAGAVEFLTKPFADDVLVKAIGQALERSPTVVAHETQLRALRECYTSLTPRERETMALVVSGLLNKQIAAELGISEITVKAHRGRVMRKMGIDSLANLVRVAAALDPPAQSTSDQHHGPIDRGHVHPYLSSQDRLERFTCTGDKTSAAGERTGAKGDRTWTGARLP